MSGSPIPPTPERIAQAVVKAMDVREYYPVAYDVFISFAAADEKRAEQIRSALEASGLRCFLSGKELKGGDEFNEVIRHALLGSRELCLLFTPNSSKSEWVLTEWGAAWVLGKRIVPILHRADVESLPDRLKSLQAIDFAELTKYAAEVRSRTPR